MYAIKAIYDGANFRPIQPITIKGKHKVVITFLDDEADDTRVIGQPIKRPRSEIMGSLKGKVWMADDFNEPICQAY